MDWNFEDYSGFDATASKPLLLSARSQQIILAVLQDMQSESAWVDGDIAAIYDEIEAQLAETIAEVITEIMTDGTPVGTIISFVGLIADIPAKWLLCNGATLTGTDYPELFAIMPPDLISGANFTLPALSNRFIRQTANDSEVANLGGELAHTLTVAELPAHHHIVPAHSHTTNSLNSTGNTADRLSRGGVSGTLTLQPTSTQPATDTSDAGSGSSFALIPPSQKFLAIIKALP